ncbi:hypothetical protein D3C77_419490 [compost metagenome]
MAVTQIHQREGQYPGLVLALMLFLPVQQHQVLIHLALAKTGGELSGRFVSLQPFVIHQPLWRIVVEVEVDISRCLLTADVECGAEVIGGEAAFPLQHDFQQAKAQGLIPGELIGGHTCSKMRHVYVISIVMSIQATYTARI